MMQNFGINKEFLGNLGTAIGSGAIQLPDFQRGWVWDDEHIRSLLASVTQSYPIGAVMLLDTGNPDIRFKARPLEGVELAHPIEPSRLILDGQQRLSSLYLALFSQQPVPTKDRLGAPIRRHYYLDIQKAISPNGDREDAILSLPEDRKLKNFRGEVIADYSSREMEYQAEILPLAIVLGMAQLLGWQMGYLRSDPDRMAERLARWNTLNQLVLTPLIQYQIPLLELGKGTPKEAVCQVFEKVNTGGVSLNAFELLTATYAADDFSLRQDWEKRSKEFQRSKSITDTSNTDFLTAVTLVSSYQRRMEFLALGKTEEPPAVSGKRKDLLRLSLEEYKRWADALTNGFKDSVKFLHQRKIFTGRDVPYRTQIIPLASILAILGKEAEGVGIQDKLARWFWSGVFGEQYGSAVETRFAKDLVEVIDWVKKPGSLEPSTITDAHFAPNRLLSLRTRNSAAYKGLFALLMAESGEDFRTGSTIDMHVYFDERIDIHHIFPQVWCQRNGIESSLCDSIINKTALSGRTNKGIGGRAPSAYLATVQRINDISVDRMDGILRTHWIEPSMLRADDFQAFFQKRQQAILDKIAKAMGKPIEADLVMPAIPIPEEYETLSDEENGGALEEGTADQLPLLG